MSQQSDLAGDGPSDAAQLALPELHHLVQRHIELVSAAAINSMARRSSSRGSNPITTGLGDYLVLASQLWAELTKSILESPAIYKAAMEVHEESRRRSHLTDLSGVVNMDLQITKLGAIRDLARKHSHDVECTWGVRDPGEPVHGVGQVAPAVMEEIDSIVRKHLHIDPDNGSRRSDV